MCIQLISRNAQDCTCQEVSYKQCLQYKVLHAKEVLANEALQKVGKQSNPLIEMENCPQDIKKGKTIPSKCEKCLTRRLNEALKRVKQLENLQNTLIEKSDAAIPLTKRVHDLELKNEGLTRSLVRLRKVEKERDILVTCFGEERKRRVALEEGLERKEKQHRDEKSALRKHFGLQLRQAESDARHHLQQVLRKQPTSVPNASSSSDSSQVSDDYSVASAISISSVSTPSPKAIKRSAFQQRLPRWCYQDVDKRQGR